MTELGVLICLLLTPTTELEIPRPTTPPPCEIARRIASRGPCLRAEDCGAYHGWQRLFGEPRTEPLDPRGAGHVARRASDPPPSYLCPAAGETPTRRTERR